MYTLPSKSWFAMYGKNDSELAFSTRTYKKGNLPLNFLKAKVEQGCKKLSAVKKQSQSDSSLKIAKAH